MSQENNKPVHRIRIGLINAAIFENASKEGQTFYNTQFERAYKDADDWKHTRSFGKDDLLALSKLSDQVHTWIYEQIQNDAVSSSE